MEKIVDGIIIDNGEDIILINWSNMVHKNGKLVLNLQGDFKNTKK